MKSIRQKETRLEALCAFLDETMRCLREHVNEMKGKMVFNPDEVSMWE
jgi:hypothetical protein